MSEKTDSAIRNLTQLASSGLVGDVEQDAFIKRFELAYELSWKWLQARIMAEGITARSPRQVFKESISLGYIQSEEAWLEMIEVRSVLVHTYNADKAREYTGQIRDSFLPLFTDFEEVNGLNREYPIHVNTSLTTDDNLSNVMLSAVVSATKQSAV